MSKNGLRIREAEDGVAVPVRVIPGASRDAVRDIHDGALRVAVNAPPEKGKANKALVRFLARILGCSRSDIEITAGHTSRHKTLHIAGHDADDLRRRLAEAMRT